METQTQATASTRYAIRPFRVDIPEEKIADLRRRITATVWPEKETVADDSQGVQLATMQALARYWADEYDWRKEDVPSSVELRWRPGDAQAATS